MTPTRPSTIRDVARQAGVSLGTVSRVLNGQPSVSSTSASAAASRRQSPISAYAPQRRRAEHAQPDNAYGGLRDSRHQHTRARVVRPRGARHALRCRLMGAAAHQFGGQTHPRDGTGRDARTAQGRRADDRAPFGGRRAIPRHAARPRSARCTGRPRASGMGGRRDRRSQRCDPAGDRAAVRARAPQDRAGHRASFALSVARAHRGVRGRAPRTRRSARCGIHPRRPVSWPTMRSSRRRSSSR